MAYTKRRQRMMDWIDANAPTIYVDYRDALTQEEVNQLLIGDFDAFSDSMQDRLLDAEHWSEHWTDFEAEFASAFGYDGWEDVPEKLAEWVREVRYTDDSDLAKDLIRNTHTVHVTATIHKPGAKSPEDLIFAPHNDHADRLDDFDRAAARYLIDAFGVAVPEGQGSKVARLRDRLEVVYGGYDREALTLIGTVDLRKVYAARKAPTHVTIGPEDKRNLLFYDHFNGCGNMGVLDLTRTRTMPATLRVDGSHGYGVDACYGFTGEVWSHEIRVST